MSAKVFCSSWLSVLKFCRAAPLAGVMACLSLVGWLWSFQPVYSILSRPEYRGLTELLEPRPWESPEPGKDQPGRRQASPAPIVASLAKPLPAFCSGIAATCVCDVLPVPVAQLTRLTGGLEFPAKPFSIQAQILWRTARNVEDESLGYLTPPERKAKGSGHGVSTLGLHEVSTLVGAPRRSLAAFPCWARTDGLWGWRIHRAQAPSPCPEFPAAQHPMNARPPGDLVIRF
ncbi:unnamed protein product [[Candida] boidinii]|uniref:Unnamed protein product n=1 Tax=Candida boidinii TaxID=5477 RepID=A0A9W6T0F3_CANBO|nr:unnamed protein product [[Candida] boidinii]GMF98953.1 unnamed protein product [[Candida] boidinii]